MDLSRVCTTVPFLRTVPFLPFLVPLPQACRSEGASHLQMPCTRVEDTPLRWRGWGVCAIRVLPQGIAFSPKRSGHGLVLSGAGG